MKKVLLVFVIQMFWISLFSQKLYVWCPEDQIAKPRPGFLAKDTINLSIFDGRVFTKNSKVECTPENTVQQISQFLRETYPSAFVNVLSPEAYYQDPEKDRITVKIGISAYHAAFGADVKVGIGSVGGNFSYGVIPEGKWNAVTALAIKLYDYRNNSESKMTKDIYKIASRPNTGGYMTAKKILNTTYLEACQDMMFFVDESLMK